MNNRKRLSLSISPTSSTSSTLANRGRNNKNLSLCLSSSTTATNYFSTASLPQKTAAIEQNENDINAYPDGPVYIMPYLYLGSEKNALDLQYIKEKLSIGAILNVAAEVNNPYEYMFQSMDDVFQDVAPSPSLSKASSVSSQASSIQTLTNEIVAYEKLPWEHNQDNLADELKKAIQIIDRARNARQNILVHCQCGVARSATVIIAYVIKTLHLSMQDAYQHVKKLAPAISPNLGLLFQLREFEQVCGTVKEEGEEDIAVEEPVAVTASTASDMMEFDEMTPINKKITPNNSGFLIRASSLSSWKRKFPRSIFSHNPPLPSPPTTVTNEKSDGWWKSNSRKLSMDTTSICY